jgi:hypothetical protein
MTMEKKDIRYEKLLQLLRQQDAGIAEVDVENLADRVMTAIRQEKEQPQKYSEALYRMFYGNGCCHSLLYVPVCQPQQESQQP